MGQVPRVFFLLLLPVVEISLAFRCGVPAVDRHGLVAALDVGSCRRHGCSRRLRCCAGGGWGEAAGGHDSRPGRLVDGSSCSSYASKHWHAYGINGNGARGACTEPVCLDGSPPAYHLHPGSGAGARSWVLQIEGGGWCNDARSCAERARTSLGSSRLMNKLDVFTGLLSNDPSMNPDFYSWNRVKLRYCDGGSFAGDSEFTSGSSVIYMRGQRIWDAIMNDLFRKGLAKAEKVLLSGCSAGGLATFFHCDNLDERLRGTATVKCMSDAGFILDVDDISGYNTVRSFFSSVVALQGAQKNVNKDCLNTTINPYQCFFPQYALQSIRAPYFIMNSAYDVYQFYQIFVPPSSDPRGQWSRCKADLSACSASQIATLQGLRSAMLAALKPLEGKSKVGIFINSCFAHCQSELQETWFARDSPRLHNKTIAKLVGDWYFERGASQEVDCAYPCDSTCHNIIPFS